MLISLQELEEFHTTGYKDICRTSESLCSSRYPSELTVLIVQYLTSQPSSSISLTTKAIMIPQPPHDPNNNRNGRPKDASHDGRNERRGGGTNENNEMEIFGGDMRDNGFVFLLFFMGALQHLLRERCIC